jgi:hypothetical protein
LFCSLFYAAVNDADYIALNDQMMVNNKLERIWKELSWPNVRYFASISNLLETSMDNDDGNLYFGYQIKKK